MGKRGNMRGKRDGDMGGEIEKRIREGIGKGGTSTYMRGEREEDMERESENGRGKR